MEPSITSIFPPPNGNAKTGVQPIIAFSEPVESAVVSLSITNGAAVPGTSVLMTPNANVVQFTPDDPLAIGTEYTATLTGTAAGGGVLTPFSWSFGCSQHSQKWCPVPRASHNKRLSRPR